MAYWIIEDKGFGGVVYKCSHCKEVWNEYYQKFPKNFCVYCGEPIDDDATEYVEEPKALKKKQKYYIRQIKPFIQIEPGHASYALPEYDWEPEDMEEDLRNSIILEEDWMILVFKERYVEAPNETISNN